MTTREALRRLRPAAGTATAVTARLTRAGARTRDHQGCTFPLRARRVTFTVVLLGGRYGFSKRILPTHRDVSERSMWLSLGRLLQDPG
jgi:hypothetical protein